MDNTKNIEAALIELNYQIITFEDGEIFIVSKFDCANEKGRDYHYLEGKDLSSLMKENRINFQDKNALASAVTVLKERVYHLHKDIKFKHFVKII